MADLNPNEQQAREVAATFIQAMADLGYCAVVILVDPLREYHWSASVYPKDLVAELLESEARGLRRDRQYAVEIKVASA